MKKSGELSELRPEAPWWSCTMLTTKPNSPLSSPPQAHQLYVTSRDFHAAPLCAPVKQRGRCSLSLTRCCEQVIYCRSRRYDILVFTFYTMQMSHVHVSMCIRRILPNSYVILLVPNLMCLKLVINNIERGYNKFRRTVPYFEFISCEFWFLNIKIGGSRRVAAMEDFLPRDTMEGTQTHEFIGRTF